MPVLTVYAYADLREYLDGAGNVRMDVSPEDTVGQVLDRLGVPRERARILFLDHHAAHPDDPLGGARRLDLFSALGGG